MTDETPNIIHVGSAVYDLKNHRITVPQKARDILGITEEVTHLVFGYDKDCKHIFIESAQLKVLPQKNPPTD